MFMSLGLDTASWAVSALVATAAVLLALLYRRLTCNHDWFLKQEVNGPSPQFLLGTRSKAWKLQLGEQDLERIQRYGKVHGTFDGSTPNLVVAEPLLIKQVLRDEATKFRSRRAYRVKNLVLHKSLLAIEGTAPQTVKQLLNSAFTTDNIKKLVPRINKTVDALAQHITKQCQLDPNVDVTKCALEYLSDALAFTVLGVDLNSDLQVKTRFTAAVDNVFTVQSPDSPFSLSPFLFEWLGSLDDFVLRKDCLTFLTDLCYTTLAQRRSQQASVEGRAVDLLDLLLAAAEEEKKLAAKDKGVDTDQVDLLLSDMEIVSQCVSVVLTVAQASKCSLALCLHTLGALPSIQDRLRSDIDRLLAKYSASSYELVQECEYLDMFLGEILRLYPLEYRLERECVEATTVGEVKLEPGCVVSVPIYAVHRLPDNYPDPTTFEPERFSPSNSAKRDHNIYLPFGQAGTNSSNIGVRLSVLFTKLAVAVLVSAFHISPADDAKAGAELRRGFTVVPQTEQLYVKAQLK